MTTQLDSRVSQQILAAALDHAESIGVQVSVAIVDAGGNLVAFLRMDGAEIAGPTLAVDKAYTAVANHISTAELGLLAAPGGPLFGIQANGGGRFVIFGGGIPIMGSGAIVGAIGVSGAEVGEDIACAAAGITRATQLLV